MKRKDDFVLQNVGGENLLVPVGKEVMDLNGFVTLNDTAVFIWEMLSEKRSIDELAAKVAEKFSIDEFTARVDVNNFLDDIKKMGLLE